MRAQTNPSPLRDRQEPRSAVVVPIKLNQAPFPARPAGQASTPLADYRLGAFYAIAAACLIALQEPFSALAARTLNAWDFIGITQVALLASIPLLIARREARADFIALLKEPRNWPKFVVLLLIGLAGLTFYDIGLSSAHPIIVAAVLNLSPFWAAIVGKMVSGKRLPGSPLLFSGCLFVAFVGAMLVAWSQIDLDKLGLAHNLLEGLMKARWLFALPMPIFFALSGALVFVWFKEHDEGAAIAANFVVSAAALIPMALLLAWRRGETELPEVSLTAILLLFIAVISSSAAGRVLYQGALTITRNDNGFVTMFFLLIPVLSALVSWPMSRWIKTLHFFPTPTFFGGMVLVSAPLLVFCFRTFGKRSPLSARPSQRDKLQAPARILQIPGE